MDKIAIVGHRRRLDSVATLLQRLSLLHVSDFTHAPELQVGPCALDSDQAQELESLRLRRTRLDALQHLLDRTMLAPLDGEPQEEPLEASELDRRLDALLPEAERIAQRIAALEEEEPAVERHLQSLRRLQPLASQIVQLQSYETVALLLDRQHADALDLLVSEVEAIADRRCEMTSGIIEPDTVGALLVFPRAHSDEIHALLGRGRVSRVRLPSQFERLGFHDSLAKMEERLAQIPGELEELKGQLALQVSGGVAWDRVRERVTRRIEQLELVSQLGATEHTFVIVGWIPRRDVAALEDSMAEAVGDEVIVTRLAPRGDDSPPVLMSNRRTARPFERLVQLFGWPQPTTIDPTGLMSIFMPLFFGMMLGDIGYGVILFGASWLVRRRFPADSMPRDLSRVMMIGAAWAIAWGILFGEVFGDLGERWLNMHPIWISRTEASAVGPLLLFAVAVGGVHITLGLLLGAWSAARANKRDKLAERLGQLAAITSLFTLAGVLADELPAGLLTPSVVGLIVGMVVIGSAHGAMGWLMGPLELVGTVGNVLSYLRLAAIGLASVYLARVANELAVIAPAVLGVIVAVLLHALNLALGAFSPTIQALRLHYVEFFSKFYDAGGTKYQPFGSSISRPAGG